MIRICIFLVAVLALGIHAEDNDNREKLVGASIANIGEFPYQVSLRMGGSHFCGGALITKRHVITAAHCVYATYKSPFSPVNAVVGTNSLSYGGSSYRVTGKSTHPNYVDKQNTDWMYDIGVLTLASEVSLSNLVSLIRLPTKDVSIGTSAVISGWGTMATPMSGLSTNLQKLNLNIIDQYNCQSKMPSFAKIHSSHICTFVQKGKGTCSGDSGGPLVQSGVLIGVVSGGIPCAIGYPDVFTNVFSFLNYVKQAIGQ